jgi:hypothetical protein
MIVVAERLGVDRLVAAAWPSTWQHGLAAIHSGNPILGYRLLLHAIASTPNAAQTLIEGLERGVSGHD